MPVDKRVATSDLSDLAGTKQAQGWRGYVDEWGVDRGVIGWAFCVGDESRAAEVELWVGDHHIATALATMDRDDVARAAGRSVAPGFVFPPSCFEEISKLDDAAQRSVAYVRIARGGPRLAAADDAPSGVQLADAWHQHLLAELSGDAVPPAEPGHKLLVRLATHRHEASRIADLPLVPIARHEAGRIESILVAPSGETWFVGWMLRAIDRELPAVILDRYKYPCAIATAAFERPDLPPDCVGVVGRVDSAWEPAPRVSDFFVYLGPNGQQHLRASSDLRLLQWQAFRDLVSEIRFTDDGAADCRLFSTVLLESNWQRGNAAVASVSAEAHVDRAFVLPGFGCLAEGWVLSPGRRVKSLEIKVGQTVLSSDERALYFKPRPDLETTHAGGVMAFDRAGFVTAFLGDLPRDVAGHISLKVRYDGGLATVHDVDANCLRILDAVPASGDVLRFFPSIAREPFFGRLHEAYQRRLAQRSVAPVAVYTTETNRLLAIQCSPMLDQLLLQIDELNCVAEQLLAADVGVALIATRGPEFAIVKRHLGGLSDSFPRLKVSLFIVEEEHGEFDALPFLLVALRARKFAYLGFGVIPTTEGWSAILSRLMEARAEITFFEIVDDRGNPDRVHGTFGVIGWQWSTPQFLAWKRHAPKFTHGSYRDNGVQNSQHMSYSICPASLLRISNPEKAPLAEALDERALLATATA